MTTRKPHPSEFGLHKPPMRSNSQKSRNDPKPQKGPSALNKSEPLAAGISPLQSINEVERDLLKVTQELEGCRLELEKLKKELGGAREAARKYNELYDLAPFGYFSLSRDGQIIDLNSTAAKSLGREMSHLKGCSFESFVSSDTKPIFNLFLKNVFLANELLFCNVTLLANEDIQNHIHIQGIKGRGGDHCLLTFVNVRIGKLAEQVLKDSENKYRILFSTEKDALILLEKETYNIIEVNEAACLLYGYSQEEMLKLNKTDLSAEPEKTLKGKQEFKERIELRYHKKKDGTLLLVDISSSIFELKGRQVILVAIRDMTIQKKAGDLNLSRLHLLEYADNHSLDDLLEETINQAEDLTGSKIGFYHFVDADQQTLILQNWSTRTKRDFCSAKGPGMSYNINQAGVWGDCLRERKAVIHNNYLSLPLKKGFPPPPPPGSPPPPPARGHTRNGCSGFSRWEDHGYDGNWEQTDRIRQ